MYALMARTTAEGAKTYLWACLADNIPPGSYTSSANVAKYVSLSALDGHSLIESHRPRSFAATEEGLRVQRKVWDELASIIMKIAPETKAVWGM